MLTALVLFCFWDIINCESIQQNIAAGQCVREPNCIIFRYVFCQSIAQTKVFLPFPYINLLNLNLLQMRFIFYYYYYHHQSDVSLAIYIRTHNTEQKTINKLWWVVLYTPDLNVVFGVVVCGSTSHSSIRSYKRKYSLQSQSNNDYILQY